jgi:hypothetical protein
MTSARRTCRKRRFDNEFEVSKWLKHMKPGTTTLRPYYHPVCGGWHITSQPLRDDGRADQEAS